MSAHCPTHKRLLVEVHSSVGPVLACPVKSCTYGRKPVGRPVETLHAAATALKLPGLDKGRQTVQLPCPKEDQEQEIFFDLVRRYRREYWEFNAVVAIPNGAWVANKAQAVKLLRTGLEPGVCDILAAVPRGGYAGYWLEMKRQRGEKPAKEQIEWMDLMRYLGYKVDWFRGGWAAWRSLAEYLGVPLDEKDLPVRRDG